MCGTWPSNLTIFDVITRIIFDEVHKLWSSALCSLLHPPATSSLLGQPADLVFDKGDMFSFRSTISRQNVRHVTFVKLRRNNFLVLCDLWVSVSLNVCRDWDSSLTSFKALSAGLWRHTARRYGTNISEDLVVSIFGLKFPLRLTN
jgi:hypothetical protein